MIFIVPHAVTPLDELRDARESPEFGREAVRLGTFENAAHDVIPLLIVESTRCAGRLDPQRCFTARLEDLDPFGDAVAMRADSSAGFGPSQSFLTHQANGGHATFEQFFRCAVWSHADIMRNKPPWRNQSALIKCRSQ